MNKKMLEIFAIVILVLGCATYANASVVLAIGDANYVGSVNDGIPSNPANEVIYINNLITLNAGDGDTTIGTETYNRVGSTLAGPFDMASATDAVKDESGDNGITFSDAFQYVLGKYDAGQAGSLVWYFADGVSMVELPETYNGFGLSHVAAYNRGGDCVVPEPTSIAVWSLITLCCGLVAFRCRTRK